MLRSRNKPLHEGWQCPDDLVPQMYLVKSPNNCTNPKQVWNQIQQGHFSLFDRSTFEIVHTWRRFGQRAQRRHPQTQEPDMTQGREVVRIQDGSAIVLPDLNSDSIRTKYYKALSPCNNPHDISLDTVSRNTLQNVCQFDHTCVSVDFSASFALASLAFFALYSFYPQKNKEWDCEQHSNEGC